MSLGVGSGVAVAGRLLPRPNNPLKNRRMVCHKVSDSAVGSTITPDPSPVPVSSRNVFHRWLDLDLKGLFDGPFLVEIIRIIDGHLQGHWPFLVRHEVHIQGEVAAWIQGADQGNIVGDIGPTSAVTLKVPKTTLFLPRLVTWRGRTVYVWALNRPGSR